MKIPVGVLGATGMVGQQYLKLLDNHPWFEVTFLAASEKSANKTFKQATQGRYHLHYPLSIESLPIYLISDLKKAKELCCFVFSALESDAAKIYEEEYAKAGLAVVSNASANRKGSDIPVLIPEINADHLKIIPIQQQNRGWKEGFIIAKPNCSLQSYLAPLYALHKEFPIKRTVITTMQAVSGAGWPGVSSFDIFDNVVPFIAGEEEKSEYEPLKILGKIENGEIKSSHEIIFSAHCNRVPVLDGHMACVSVEFASKIPSEQEAITLLKNFKGLPQELNLPSAPKNPIIYRDEQDRPQTRLDRDSEKGMAITVGRLRPCSALHLRFVGLSHNTGRGAAGGGILNAELLKALNYL